MARAIAHFVASRVTVSRVMTGTDPATARVLAKLLAEQGIRQKRTRPSLSESERIAAFGDFLHSYSCQRGHTH
jgi:hypothetical protein